MNFFKHADSDPNAALRFGPVVTEFFLIDAVQMYSKLYGSPTPLMLTFRAWFMCIRGQHTSPMEEIQVFLPKGVKLQDVRSLGRTEFMEYVLPRFAAQYPLGGPPQGV
jgi:hypothetical protein